MDAARFEFRSFKPRAGVGEELNRILNRFMRDDAPRGAQNRALIAATPTGFQLSVVVRVGDSFFNSEISVTKKQLAGVSRNWQIGEVAKMLQDLRGQIGVWARSRVMTPVPLKSRPKRR